MVGLGSAIGQELNVTIDDADCAELDTAERITCFGRQVEEQWQERAGAAAAAAAAAQRATAADPDAEPAPGIPASGPVPSHVAETARDTPPASANASQTSTRRKPASAAIHRSTRSEETFGRAAQPEAIAEIPAPLQEVVGTIAEIRETVPNTWLVTLENGQVWQQTLPKRYPLRTGHEVRIYTARLGGYRLSSSTVSGFIRVERVR